MTRRLKVRLWRLRLHRLDLPSRIIAGMKGLLVVGAVLGILAVIVIWGDCLPQWTGIPPYELLTTVDVGPSSTTSTTAVRGKTLWDLAELLIVPMALAGFAVWFNKRLRDSDAEVTEEHLREQAFQAYLDRTSDLLLDHNLYEAKKNSDVRFIARARALNVLRRLDGSRKGLVLAFLYSLDLVQCKLGEGWEVLKYPIIGLIGADLAGVSIPGGALTCANLKDIFLCNSHLESGSLRGVDLSGADLSISWLLDADLRQAKFHNATLKGAILAGATLDGADLTNANLENAIVTPGQLERAKRLDGCVMPNGRCYDSQATLADQCQPAVLHKQEQ
jgi:uncharacterized protein YjbI with pentapeptide repeats